MTSRAVPRPGPEFSRPFAVEALGEEELVERIEATAEERAAVARRLGLVALDRLAATLRIGRGEEDSLILVAGHMEAEATQSCVVTLAPVDSRLGQDFALRFLAASDDGGEIDPVEIDADAEDPPEPLGPEGLDLGEAVVQQLAMALEPYPRSEGASLEALDWTGAAADEPARESPFKGLKDLAQGR